MDFRESVAGRVLMSVMVVTIGASAAILLVTAEARNRHDHDPNNATQMPQQQQNPPPANDTNDYKGNKITDIDESMLGMRKSRQISLEAHSSSQQFINTKDASDEGPDNLLDGVLAVLRRHLLEYPTNGDQNRDSNMVERLQMDKREVEQAAPTTHKIRHRASKRRRRRFSPHQEQGYLIESVDPLDNVVIVNDERRSPYLRRPPTEKYDQESVNLIQHEDGIAALPNVTAEELNVRRMPVLPENVDDQIATTNYSGAASFSSHWWLVVAMLGWSLLGMLLIVLACLAFCYNTSQRPKLNLGGFRKYIDQQPPLMYDPSGSHQGDDEDTYENDVLDAKSSDKKDHGPFYMNTDVSRIDFPPLHWLLSNLPPRSPERTGIVDYLDDTTCLLDDDDCCILDYDESDGHASHDSLLNTDVPAVHSAATLPPRRSLSLTDLSV